MTSLLGVILISRPPFIFGAQSDPKEHYNYGFTPESASRAGWSGAQVDKIINEAAGGLNDVVTAHERMVAVGWALVGVAGASGACKSGLNCSEWVTDELDTTIRAIGKRAHPLHSISYFAMWCTLVSALLVVVLQYRY